MVFAKEEAGMIGELSAKSKCFFFLVVFFPKCESSRILCLSAVLCLGTAPSDAVYLKDIPATGRFCPTLSLLTKIVTDML